MNPALLNTPGLVLPRTTASAGEATRDTMGILAVNNAAAVLAGEPALTPVRWFVLALNFGGHAADRSGGVPQGIIRVPRSGRFSAFGQPKLLVDEQSGVLRIRARGMAWRAAQPPHDEVGGYPPPNGGLLPATLACLSGMLLVMTLIGAASCATVARRCGGLSPVTSRF